MSRSLVHASDVHKTLSHEIDTTVTFQINVTITVTSYFLNVTCPTLQYGELELKENNLTMHPGISTQCNGLKDRRTDGQTELLYGSRALPLKKHSRLLRLPRSQRSIITIPLFPLFPCRPTVERSSTADGGSICDHPRSIVAGRSSSPVVRCNRAPAGVYGIY